MEHLDKTDDIIEEIWQVERADVFSELLYHPVEVDLDTLAKRVVANCALQSLECLQGKHFFRSFARYLIKE